MFTCFNGHSSNFLQESFGMMRFFCPTSVLFFGWHIYIHIYIYYTYVCIYVYVCVCVHILACSCTVSYQHRTGPPYIPSSHQHHVLFVSAQPRGKQCCDTEADLMFQLGLFHPVCHQVMCRFDMLFSTLLGMMNLNGQYFGVS